MICIIQLAQIIKNLQLCKHLKKVNLLHFLNVLFIAADQKSESSN